MPHADSMFSPAQFINFQKRGTVKVRRKDNYEGGSMSIISVRLIDEPNVVILGAIHSEWLVKLPA